MSSFSASDAAVSGFRFIGRHPKTVAIWAGVLFAYEIIWGALAVGLASDQLTLLRAFSRANGQDPEAAMAMLRARRLRIVSESLFDVGHRRIVFEVGSGDVWMRRGRPEDGMLLARSAP